MGCTLSRILGKGRKYAATGSSEAVEAHVAAGPPSAAAAAAGGPSSKAADPPVKRARLDPKDFMFMHLKGETRVKLPGDINGQQFVIDSCEDCDIYLLDHCAMVTIDDCKNCRIFVGPTDSSVFIRTSSGCRCVFLCRQLRTREVTDCTLQLLCRTRPIIESSSGLTFSCYSASYSQQPAHLAACKLSPFHNFWSDIHDFTPPTSTAAAAAGGGGHGSSAAASSNYSLVAPAASLVAHMGRELPDAAATLFAVPPTSTSSSSQPAAAAAAEGGAQPPPAAAAAAAAAVGPWVTWGNRPLPGWASTNGFLLFPPTTPGATISQLLQDACSCSGGGCGSASSAGREGGGAQQEEEEDGIVLEEACLLVRTNQAPLAAGDLQQLAAKAGWGTKEVKAFPGVCVGVEVAGTPAAVQQLEAAAAATGKALVTSSAEVAKQFRLWGMDG